MSLPKGYPADTRRSQALVLSGFVGFQALDAITTHVGLTFQHVETNRLMGPLISIRGELLAYALKGLAVALLLAILMLLQYRKPRVWQVFHAAAWVSALAVVANVAQLVG